MSTNAHPLGICPHCETPIPSHRLLIKYTTSVGSEMYADCPNCRDVVHPA